MIPANKWKEAITTSQRDLDSVVTRLEEAMAEGMSKAIRKKDDSFTIQINGILSDICDSDVRDTTNCFHERLVNNGYHFRYTDCDRLEISLKPFPPTPRSDGWR